MMLRDTPLIGRSVIVPSTFQRTTLDQRVSIAPTLIDIVNDGMSFSPGAPVGRIRIFSLS